MNYEIVLKMQTKQKLQKFLCAIALFSLILTTSAQDYEQSGEQLEGKVVSSVKPGRYVPELFGALRGKYQHDPRGFYQHMKVPYDGGYGDRGNKYEHDGRGIFNRPGAPFALGPRDHLRFMIDFNYNSSGYQVIQFEWIRDGDEELHYNYIDENKLWNADAKPNGYDYSRVKGERFGSNENGDTVVHVDGDYDAKSYNVSYTQENESQAAPNENDIRETLNDILEYIQVNILPSLN